ncbi:MAG: hypothetical protein ACXU8N_06110 [Telluria sp.]
MMNPSAIALAFITTLPVAASACQLTSVEPRNGELHIGNVRWALGEADDEHRPSAWQGPLHAGRCSIELGIIERPFALTSNSMLFLNTYSGSERELNLVDLKACKVRWKSGRFVGNVTLDARGLRLGKRSIRLSESCWPFNEGG